MKTAGKRDAEWFIFRSLKNRAGSPWLCHEMKAHHQLRREIGYGASRPMFLENDMAFESKADSVKSLAIDGRSHTAPNVFGQ